MLRLENQVNFAVEILSALLAGGFILFFVENQHIERDVIDRFRILMDPYYHKLSCYLKFVYFIKERISFSSTDSKYVANFKFQLDEFSRKGVEVHLHSEDVPYKLHKELSELNDSINNVWWLYNEANVKDYITDDIEMGNIYSDSDIHDALSNISPKYKGQPINKKLLSSVSADFYVDIWQPVQYVTLNYEYWDKKCRFNKFILLFSLISVMLVLIVAMLFSSDINNHIISTSTILCCLFFIFVLLQLNKLMKLSHNIFGKLPSWKANNSKNDKKTINVRYKNTYSEIFKRIRKILDRT